MQAELLHLGSSVNMLEREVPSERTNIEMLMDNKNTLTLKARHYELQTSEMTLRIEEIDEKYNRRDDELQLLHTDI